MRLSKPMIEVFAEIAKGNNALYELAKAQKKSVNWISEVIQELEKEGFVTKNRSFKLKGSRIAVEISNTNHAIKLKELISEYSAINFEDILADSKLLFLVSLSEDWIDMKTLTNLSKVSKYMIDRYRPIMKNRGIILQKSRLYKINEKAWLSLKNFLIAYKNYSITSGVVKWKYNKEIIFELNNENLIQENTTTGFYAYKNYDVQVRVISALCISPKRKLSKEEVFVHSLFEVKDPRTLHLALTFYFKNKLDYKKVLPIAMKYGKYTMFENLVNLLKTLRFLPNKSNLDNAQELKSNQKVLDVKEEKMKLDGLPAFDRKDFIRIANMYGVKNVQ